MSLRDVAPSTPNPGESLFRTMAMAMVIAGFICFAAMFWPLYQNRPENADLAYYLPWCLAYGIPNMLMAGLGVYFTTVSKDKPALYKPGDIVGIVAGGLLVGEAFPIIIVLHHTEFFISVLVIGGCLIVLGALALSSIKQKNQ